MKKTLILILVLSASVVAMAQNPRGKHQQHNRPEVSQLVSDLSATQKRKVDAIGHESKERVAKLRAQQKNVRDSISTFMKREGDNSAVIFPLFDREAYLQAEVSREMYNTKIRIDQVLTREQRAELHKALENRKKKK